MCPPKTHHFVFTVMVMNAAVSFHRRASVRQHMNGARSGISGLKGHWSQRELFALDYDQSLLSLNISVRTFQQLLRIM
jgi:hypothetical protein